MNGDASISVVDPIVSMTGRTSLYATVLLPRPGADWAKTRDEKRLFVSMPLAAQVAVVDTEAFKLIGAVDAGPAPARVALQPDERFLWVGNDGRRPGESGVTVIDPGAMKAVANIRTGKGHHEIAFSGDSRLAFVTNREEGTVSVVDVARLAKVKDLAVGPAPISIAFSILSEVIYVADGKDGHVSVIDPRTLAVSARITAKPGLGPMRFTSIAANQKGNVSRDNIFTVGNTVDPAEGYRAFRGRDPRIEALMAKRGFTTDAPPPARERMTKQ